MRPVGSDILESLEGLPQGIHRGTVPMFVCAQTAPAFQGEKLQLIKDIVAGMDLKTTPHRSAISGINYSPKSGHTVGSNLKKHIFLLSLIFRFLHKMREDLADEQFFMEVDLILGEIDA